MAKGAPIHKLARPDRPLRESATILLVRLNEMMEWAESVHDPECVEELHNMRIAAKRLRYSLEFFAPTLGPAGEELLGTIEEIQEQLGKIHDCDVIIPLVSETLEKELERERRQAARKGSGVQPEFIAAEGLVALMVRKRDERERRYKEFIAHWDALPPLEFAARFTRVVADPMDNLGPAGDVPPSPSFDDPTS